MNTDLDIQTIFTYELFSCFFSFYHRKIVSKCQGNRTVKNTTCTIKTRITFYLHVHLHIHESFYTTRWMQTENDLLIVKDNIIFFLPLHKMLSPWKPNLFLIKQLPKNYANCIAVSVILFSLQWKCVFIEVLITIRKWSFSIITFNTMVIAKQNTRTKCFYHHGYIPLWCITHRCRTDDLKHNVHWMSLYDLGT